MSTKCNAKSFRRDTQERSEKVLEMRQKCWQLALLITCRLSVNGLAWKARTLNYQKLPLREQQLTSGGYETGEATSVTTGRQLRL